ncbi:MAG: DNA mismatch repair protein MutS, partial [Opitutales bacterium]|nr:DNA mismatch repair protein MutS [Opitutales bacterium]
YSLQAAWADLSSGEFCCAEFDKPENFLSVLSAINPRELLLPETKSQNWKTDPHLMGWNAIFRSLADLRPVSLLPEYRFAPDYGENLVKELLGVMNLGGFGFETGERVLGAAGALVFYASENLRGNPKNIFSIRKLNTKKCLLIDAATQRNLEIFRASNGLREGSLLAAIDRTKTPTGARLLESYLASPTIDILEISRRQDAVESFYSAPAECMEIAELLKNVRDIPRILGRLQNRLRSPRELGALLQSISQIEPIKAVLRAINPENSNKIEENLGEFSELIKYLSSALADELPAKIQDGGAIRDGFDKELDDLRLMSRDSKTWLANLEREEQQKTGIKNLRIKYNGAFGYFIEITKSNLSLVPPHYIRRQTMTNAERYTTEDLRKKEREILHSEVAAMEREDALFTQIVEKVLGQFEPLMKASHAMAEIDVFRGWAELARERDYCRPVVDEGDEILIENGRHPVVEQVLSKNGASRTQAFVPNDTQLSSAKNQIALITGPNMAGKSTYIRQVALICLLAQTGSFVPASSCKMGILDRIFSRVGASDELAKGNSTFMVEMNETANILNNATSRSLIILDEIGRGTSTYDGLSIAWGVVEYLHGENSSGPKTLFATHYHELTRLEGILPRLVNCRVAVKEWNDEIIFIRKIERGAADKSYGIQVARLAGLPQEVIERAKEILNELESEGANVREHLSIEKNLKKTAAAKRNSPDWDSRQMSLF